MFVILLELATVTVSLKRCFFVPPPLTLPTLCCGGRGPGEEDSARTVIVKQALPYVRCVGEVSAIIPSVVFPPTQREYFTKIT